LKELSERLRNIERLLVLAFTYHFTDDLNLHRAIIKFFKQKTRAYLDLGLVDKDE